MLTQAHGFLFQTGMIDPEALELWMTSILSRSRILAIQVGTGTLGVAIHAIREGYTKVEGWGIMGGGNQKWLVH